MNLPNFMIIGERRCGTTSLYHWIKSHPEIFLFPKADYGFFIDEQLGSRKPPKEEIIFENWDKNHSEESLAEDFRDSSKFQIRGGKCADIFFWVPAYERLKCFMPDGRFVLILRNPVKRAWSHYWNEVGKGREKLSFLDAINRESERSKKSAYEHFHFSYLERGLYYKNLIRFLEIFPIENLLIITTEEMHGNPVETIQKVYEFLELESNIGLENAGSRVNENWITVPKDWATLPVIKNVSNTYNRFAEAMIIRTTSEGYKRRTLRKKTLSVFQKPVSEMKMTEEIKEKLIGFYKDDIAELEKLVGRQLKRWVE